MLIALALLGSDSSVDRSGTFVVTAAPVLHTQTLGTCVPVHHFRCNLLWLVNSTLSHFPIELYITPHGVGILAPDNFLYNVGLILLSSIESVIKKIMS